MVAQGFKQCKASAKVRQVGKRLNETAAAKKMYLTSAQARELRECCATKLSARLSLDPPCSLQTLLIGLMAEDTGRKTSKNASTPVPCETAILTAPATPRDSLINTRAPDRVREREHQLYSLSVRGWTLHLNGIYGTRIIMVPPERPITLVNRGVTPHSLSLYVCS